MALSMDSLYNTQRVSMGNLSKAALATQPRTINDWLAVTSGGQRSVQYGYFGPGHLLRKNIANAGDTFVGDDFFTNTFGAKVWDSLNSQTRMFNLVRKVAWGPTTGWRIRSGRNLSTQGVAETAVLPTIDSPDLERVYIQPSFIVTSMGVSALAQFLATLEGGLGDALAVAQEAAEVDHLKKINQMLLAPSHMRVVDVSGQTVTLGTGGGDYVSIGDVFTRSGANNTIAVTGIDGDVLTVTGTVPSDDEVLTVSSRAGITSLSDIIEEDSRTVSGVNLTDSQGAAYGNQSGGNRTSGGWNAAGYISGNAGTLRHLTTGHLDRVIQQIRVNGFQPDLLVTGVEQEVRLGTILQANQHFIGEGEFQVKQGGEATLPGYQTGFEVATYKKIPLFTDADMSPVWQLAGNGDDKRGTDVYVLDTRYLEVPVLFTTQYMESRDYIHNNMLGIKAIFLTAANVRALNFRAQGKVTDLSDGVNIN